MHSGVPIEQYVPIACRTLDPPTFQSINKNSICVVFRAQMREKHLARRTEADLNKGQKSCRQLDLARDFTEPVEVWFWPPDPKERLLQVGEVFRIRI